MSPSPVWSSPCPSIPASSARSSNAKANWVRCWIPYWLTRPASGLPTRPPPPRNTCRKPSGMPPNMPTARWPRCPAPWWDKAPPCPSERSSDVLIHRRDRVVHRCSLPVGLQHPRFLGLEQEIVRQQILRAVALLRHAERPVAHRVGEDVVKLVGQHAAQCTPISGCPISRAERQQPRLRELPDPVATDVGKRQNLPVADMRPAERSFKAAARRQASGVAPSLERDHRQLRGHFVSTVFARVPPLETKSDRRHDRRHFFLDCFQHARLRCLLELGVQGDGGERRHPCFAEAGNGARQEAKPDELH